MELKLIPHRTCPDCNSITVAESCPSTHSNGQGFERREFACGAAYKWSPNANRLEQATICPKTIEAKTAIEHRRRLVEQIKRVIERSDADDNFKWTISNYLPRFQ